MAAIYPPVAVEAPPAGPLRYGLFNAARKVIQEPIASVGGVQFQPTTCGGAHLYTAECPPSAQNTKTFDLATETVTTAPFWAYGSVVCSPVGRDIEEQAQRARQRLLAGEQTQVEAAFWNGGGVGATPNLNAIGATVLTPTLTSFGARLSALEAAFYAVYGYQGTIHVNTAAEGAAAFGNMIVRPDTPDIPSHLVTPIGSIWSFGAGYGTTGPAGAPAAADSVWAFMTGPVTVWQDADISMPDPYQTFNRTTNQATVEATRAYNVAPDCGVAFAIQLPLEAP
jgi:hypothetical protein